MAVIALSSFQINPAVNGGYGTTDLEVRWWYNRGFIDSSTVFVQGGNGQDGFYITSTCTVSGGGIITVPSTNIYSTLDAIDPAPQSIQFFGRLYSNGAPKQWVTAFSSTATGWVVQSPTPATLTYEQLVLQNQAIVLANAPVTFWTIAQTKDYIASLTPTPLASDVVIGRTKLSVAPVSSIDPIAVGDNDPRMGDWFNILTYGAATTNTAAQNVTALGLAITAAGTGGLYVPVGSFPLNSISIGVPIIFAPGPSILRPATGQSITISDTITADLSQHFNNALSGQGSIVLSSNLTVDSVPPQWWGATFDGATDDAAAIQAAVTAIAGRGGWVDFSDAAGVHATINVPNLVGLRSGNTRRGGMTALSGHAGPFMLSIENGVSSAFDNYIQNFNLNCSDIAGLGGITTKSWQENSGIRNGIIQGFRTYGLYYEGGGGGASTNLCEEAEIFAGASGATAGIKISSGVPDGLIVRVVSSVITGAMARGIDVVKASLECETVHFEECTTGIYLDGVGNHVLINVSGGSGMTNVVEIASTFTGTLQMIGCFRNGATNLLKDNRVGGLGTITTDDPSIIISTVGATVRTDGSVKLTGEMTLVGANTTNLSLYKSVDGTGNGISLSDSLNTTADHENLFITIDPANSLGFGAGALFAATASGSGTTQDVRVFNGDAKSVIFGTTNLERARFIPSGAFAQIEGAVLSVSANAIAPTHSIHHCGAGLIKTITLPSGFASGTIYIIPDAAFTYDATGNIVVPLGGGTAVVGQVMVFTYSSSSGKWYPSY